MVVGTQERVKMLEYIEQFKEEREPINGVGNIMRSRDNSLGEWMK